MHSASRGVGLRQGPGAYSSVLSKLEDRCTGRQRARLHPPVSPKDRSKVEKERQVPGMSSFLWDPLKGMALELEDLE